MSEKEKDITKTLAEAMKALPNEKKEYLMGYAEGVNAMAAKGEVTPESDVADRAS